MVAVTEYLLVMLLVSVLAGLIGSMVGIGGGILLVPALTLGFGVPIPYAVGASIISVIATSSGSASAYVRDGITNLRIGMFLEIGTSVGAVFGAITTVYLAGGGLTWLLFLTFGAVLVFSSYGILNNLRRERKGIKTVSTRPNVISERLNLKGEYYDKALKKNVAYTAANPPGGFSVMFVAGFLSSLLGIGSGTLKVLGMDTMMKLPFKVSTTTSNFMMGVTAAVSTGIFYVSGFINPILAAPTAIGVVIGAFTGTRVLARSKPVSLRIIFAVALVIIGVEMMRQGLTA